ncbi:PAS and ANTAR domain-containing protein [Mycobacterium sp. WMMD1722]|uniref:PAS and ANTAR domain-containing protein n=1 Tax=Mycobacterium sp. WMMD1722 TaxID=3404117 RepID=UPI003BF5E81A
MPPEHLLERALAGGTPQNVGWFRFHFADERWEWSDQVQLMHGYEPGTVTPTTELVLAHKHPDDYVSVAATLDDILRSRRTFSTRHRIIDVQKRVHDVVAIGDRMLDESGEIIGTQGFYVDVTETTAQSAREMAAAAAAAAAEHRASIERAKGMLMLVYRVDAVAAFELLKWRASEAKVKLRTFAERLLTDFTALYYEETLPPRSTFDHVLLTVHQRVDAAGV